MNFASKRQATPKKLNTSAQSTNHEQLAKTITKITNQNAQTLQKIREIESQFQFELYQAKKYQNTDSNFIKDVYQRQLDKLLEQKATLDNKLHAYKIKAQKQTPISMNYNRYKLTNQYMFLRNTWTRFQQKQSKNSQQHIQHLNKAVSTLRANITDMIKWQRQKPTLPQYSLKQNQGYQQLKQKYENIGMELEQLMSQFSKQKLKSTFLERKNEQLNQQVQKMRKQICKYENLLNSYRNKIEKIQNKTNPIRQNKFSEKEQQKDMKLVSDSLPQSNKRYFFNDDFEICITSVLQQPLNIWENVNQKTQISKSLSSLLKYLLNQEEKQPQKVSSIEKTNHLKSSTGKQTFEKFLSQRNISEGLNKALKNHDKLLAIRNDFAKNKGKQSSKATKNTSICSEGTKKQTQTQKFEGSAKSPLLNPQKKIYYMNDYDGV